MRSISNIVGGPRVGCVHRWWSAPSPLPPASPPPVTISCHADLHTYTLTKITASQQMLSYICIYIYIYPSKILVLARTHRLSLSLARFIALHVSGVDDTFGGRRRRPRCHHILLVGAYMTKRGRCRQER